MHAKWSEKTVWIVLAFKFTGFLTVALEQRYSFHLSFSFEGLVNKLLSARFWIPLSRLTYCAYLVHPIIIFALFQSYETVRAYSDVHLVSATRFSVFRSSHCYSFREKCCAQCFCWITTLNDLVFRSCFPYQAFCFVGVLGISYAAAFIVSVCVEYPMMQLEKFIFKSDKWAQVSWMKVCCLDHPCLCYSSTSIDRYVITNTQ